MIMARKMFLISAAACFFIFLTTTADCIKAQVKNNSSITTQMVGSKTEEEDDIRESVFRHQFGHNASGIRQKAKTYYLALGSLINKRDPSSQFMQRFKGHKPSVEGASLAEQRYGRIRDGLIFYIEEIRWINENEVEVSGGYYEGNMSSSGNKYQVVRKNGKWAVKKDTRIWIS
jgi:hypothetical protein